MKKVLLVPFLLVGLTGCGLKYVGPANTVDKPVQTTSNVIVDSMSSVSKADADVLYKVFSGMALYVEQTKKVDNTLRMFTLVDAVEKDFGYKKGTPEYVKYTDAVEKMLTDKGYKKAKKIVDNVTDELKEVTRVDVVNDLKYLAEAARIVRESKK